MNRLISKIILLVLFTGFFIGCEKGDDSGLSESEVIEGLKEALKVGTNNSVVKANEKNGYYGDLRIKVPFPEDALVIKNTLENTVPVIAEPLIDTLIVKLNRAAENAAIKAKPIFIDAILNITFTDALNILNGSDNAATMYLKTNTYSSLGTAFKPDIQVSLEEVGAQQAWKAVTKVYNSIPFVEPVNNDLAQFTTDKALTGLFVLIADEEAKIRKDPVARINDILKKVFGY
ncbi:MAG: DUF4197 domain-containing protein [Bacteroidales bacterium]|nr:DUF4197 domain-containing protein [Bacteroidales bacterium]